MNTYGAAALLLSAVLSLSVGCSSTNGESSHDLGTQTVGVYQVHLIQEGTYLPGNTTKYAIQPSPGKPDAIECWFGAMDSTSHVQATYDPNDNDFDCTLTTPAAPAATDKVYFTLKTGTTSATGSFAPQP